ncbi:MAG: hypothetical protein M3Y72_14905, partial [Acidobacteriota bacterium]|nr:hypothetical protein [Acidobacteriota bacterium]
LSEGGAAQANILDFASDPVLSRTVKLGLLEIIVDENHGHHRIGRLVVRGEPNFARFTDFLQREPGVNEIDSIGIPVEGALPVASEYQNPIRLQFVPNKE